MGLFGGGNSSTNTNTTNNAYDQRQVTDASQGGFVGSGNSIDSSSTLTTSDSGNTWANSGNTSTASYQNSGNTSTSYQALDNGAVGLAFNGINTTTKQAFGFGSDALGFAGDAFKRLTDSVSDALNFATQTQKNSYAASSGALDKAVGAMTDALSFGGKQTASALSSLQTSSNVLDRAYADAKGRGGMTDYLIGAAIVGALFVAWKATR